MRQEKGGKHGGKSKGKGIMHKGLGFQPERGEQRRFGGYCNWCWRIGQKISALLVKQEYSKNNPPQDTLQRDIREWTNPKGQVTSSPKVKEQRKGKGKRKHPGNGNHNQDHAGSRMKKLDSAGWMVFGIKSQRLVGDVQEHNDDF